MKRPTLTEVFGAAIILFAIGTMLIEAWQCQ